MNTVIKMNNKNNKHNTDIKMNNKNNKHKTLYQKLN